MYDWGIASVRRVYDGDPEFDMPMVVVEDGSVQPAHCQHSQASTWAATRVTAARPVTSPCAASSSVSRWAVVHFG